MTADALLKKAKRTHSWGDFYQVMDVVQSVLAQTPAPDGGWHNLRDALQPLLAAADKVTEGRYKCAEIADENLDYECPMCQGDGNVEGSQYINFDNAPLNVLFSGIGDEHVRWQELFDGFVKVLPKLKAAFPPAPAVHDGEQG